MGKIKPLIRNLSLRKSIVLYLVTFVVIALLLSGTTAILCNGEVQKIRNSYPTSATKYYLTDENGVQLGDGEYIGTTTIPLSKQDEQRIAVLELFPMIATPIYSSLCIIAAAMLFYRNKLKRPLSELKAASEKISKNDLDFSVAYNSTDELGQLCHSFEIMRSTLAANFSEMWRQIEDRKQLNAAFAHDLRTPLTVLKGYDEILQNSRDPQTRDTAITMAKHITRLERYIASMSNLRRLEDMQPECDMVSLRELITTLYDSADMECKAQGKNFCLQEKLCSGELFVDRSCISQVCNNLIVNAARYATSTITLFIEEQKDGLLLEITDDGPGFSKGSLHKATDPYFTEEKENGQHFGLGLYICKMLCEHHWGYLKLENIGSGAKVSAFFKSR